METKLNSQLTQVNSSLTIILFQFPQKETVTQTRSRRSDGAVSVIRTEHLVAG